jgi:spore maturation protein CgeB
MRILLIGSGVFYGVSAFFRHALESMDEHQFTFLDEDRYSGRSLVHRIAYRLLGRRPLAYWAFNRDVLIQAQKYQPQIVLVVKGAHLAPRTLARVKQTTGAFLVNYATDDPFNPSHRHAGLIASIRYYDLYVSTKRAIMDDVRQAGCSDVIYVPFGYAPELHFPEKPATQDEMNKFTCDVVFAGGGDADRFPILRAIASIPDIALHLYGGYWKKDTFLAPYARGFVLGRDYRLALGRANIALCLVRRANRDGHVMRTFEVPACGGFMLAERTEEHLELFEENKEAVFFSSTEELVEKTRFYLAHESDRNQIAENGYKRVVEGNNTYTHRLQDILTQARSRMI